MARVSQADVQKFKDQVISALKQEYECGLISRTISNYDIDILVQKYKLDRIPYWLREEKAGRGQYDISGYLGIMPDKKVSKEKAKKQEPEPEYVLESVAQVVPMKKKQTINEDVKAYVPQKDPNFVKFGNYKDLKSIVASGIFFPTFIYGPTGNGKTMSVEQIHNELNKPLIRINMTASVDEDQLIGTKTLVDGNIEIIEGPVLIAMRLGCTILIDEIDASNENAIMCLQSILEGGKNGKPYYFKLKNEIVTPKEGFNIIATANTKGQGSEDGRYVGTRVLNEAFLERFVGTLVQDYPPEKVERDIVTKMMEDYGCYNESIMINLVKWSTAIRITFADGGCNELITTRRLAHIVKAYAIFKDIKKAVGFCVNRFDSGTASAFANLFDKVCGEVVSDSQSQEPGFPPNLSTPSTYP
jgi:hypothetical protein